jgi:uncharacterized membrane protein YqjE
MATRNRIEHMNARTDGATPRLEQEPQMRDLLKQLASEGGDLVRGEVALAKLEMRDMARQLAADSAKVAIAIGIALTGLLALLAAAVIGLGNLLGGQYALSALIIGAVMLAVGGALAMAGINGLKGSHKPEQTVRSLKQGKEWAREEVAEFKREVRS